MTPYDDSNIFARILRGELPCNKILETGHALAFHDINPQAPVHALVLPKGKYRSMDDFTAAPEAEIAGLWRAVGEVAHTLGLAPDGYRIIVNHGGHAHQEVFHLHIHVLGGRPLGPMIEGGATPPDGTWKRSD